MTKMQIAMETAFRPKRYADVVLSHYKTKGEAEEKPKFLLNLFARFPDGKRIPANDCLEHAKADGLFLETPSFQVRLLKGHYNIFHPDKARMRSDGFILVADCLNGTEKLDQVESPWLIISHNKKPMIKRRKLSNDSEADPEMTDDDDDDHEDDNANIHNNNNNSNNNNNNNNNNNSINSPASNVSNLENLNILADDNPRAVTDNSLIITQTNMNNENGFFVDDDESLETFLLNHYSNGITVNNNAINLFTLPQESLDDYLNQDL